MRPLTRYLLAGCLVASLATQGWAAPARNVVLIVCDGLRWQEVFSGADALLLNDQAGGSWTPESVLRQQYWSDDPLVRRRLLFPFIWGTIAAHGSCSATRMRAAGPT